MPKVIIVNQDDEPIGLEVRNKLKSEDTYRVSALWITNSNGDVLLAQRKANKKIEPLCWGPAVSGTVEEGEDYESNIYKEMEEELGLTNFKLKLFKKFSPQSLGGNYFVQLYTLKEDLDINSLKLQEEELESVAWFNAESLKQQIRNKPEKFVASAPFWEIVGLL